MIWKAAAEEKLTQYPAQLAAVQNLQEQLKLLDFGDLKSPQYNRPRVSATPGRQEDKLLNALAKKQEMEWSLARAQTWVRVTQRALDTLAAEEQAVLKALYMDPECSLAQLCDRMAMERTAVYRRRDQALRKFTMALYGS